MEIIKLRYGYYNQAKNIYTESFPKEERYLSFKELANNAMMDNAQMYCLIDEDVVQGLIYNIIYEDMVFVLYLAVNFKSRHKGYGSKLIQWCLENYEGKSIYLNIDEVDKRFKDYDIRVKRLNFYLKNGFKMTDYLSVEEGCNFNILSNTGDLDLDKYIKLDLEVERILKDKPSKIVKREELL